MSVEPNILENLFTQLIDQGLQTRHLHGIVKTLDGQFLLTTQHVQEFILTWMKEHGNVFFSPYCFLKTDNTEIESEEEIYNTIHFIYLLFFSLPQPFSLFLKYPLSIYLYIYIYIIIYL